LNRPLARFSEADDSVELRFYRIHKTKNPAQPERALLFAVLSEAIETFKKFRFAKSVRGRVLFREAEQWICDGDSDYLFSFKNICDVMGMNPPLLRRGLIEWAGRGQETQRQQHLLSTKSVEKKRHNANRAPGARRRCRSPRLKGGWLN